VPLPEEERRKAHGSEEEGEEEGEEGLLQRQVARRDPAW
jgi:hypothetical protein